MCIATVISDTYRRRTGYKLLIGKDDNYYTGVCGVPRIKITKKRFSKANTSVIPIHGGPATTTHTAYTGGFHIFTRKSEALKIHKWFPELTMCKVGFRTPTLYGIVNWHFYEDDRECTAKTHTVVATQCKIIEEVQ